MSIPRFGVKDLLLLTLLVAIYCVTFRNIASGPVVGPYVGTDHVFSRPPSQWIALSVAFVFAAVFSFIRYLCWRRMGPGRIRISSPIYWSIPFFTAVISFLVSVFSAEPGGLGVIGYSMRVGAFSIMFADRWVGDEGVLTFSKLLPWKKVRHSSRPDGQPAILHFGLRWLPFDVKIPEKDQQAVAEMIAINKNDD